MKRTLNKSFRSPSPVLGRGGRGVRAILALTLLCLCALPAAHAQTVLSGHHDNNPNYPDNEDGYDASGGIYLVPSGATFDNNGLEGLYVASSTITVSGGAFRSNGDNGLFAASSTVTVNGGTFSNSNYANYNSGLLVRGCSPVAINGGTFNNNGSGIYNDGSLITINGGTFSANNCGLCDSESPLVTINGGTFSGNYYGLFVDTCTVTINGGTFSGNTPADFEVVSSGRIDLYGTFDGVSAGKTKTLNATDQVQSFHGTLQKASAAQTFTYITESGDSGTIVLHGVTTSNPALQVTKVTLKDQTDKKATLSSPDTTATLPFAFGTASKDSDTIHWETTPAPSGTTLHWKVTAPSGGAFASGKSGGTGAPTDFQITVPAGSYFTTRRDALSFTLEAWETNDSAPAVRIADVKTTITQDELGQLRQEYADHPLTPVKSDSYGNATKLKKVPDISNFVDTVNGDTSKSPFNKGLSNWAIVTSFLQQEYADVAATNGGTPLSFNSAYRNPIKNEMIYEAKGVTTNNSSQHMWGDAMDFSTDGSLKSYLAVAQKVINANAQCIWENDTSHVHVQKFFLLGTPAQPKGAKLTVASATIKEGQSVTGTLVLSQSSRTDSKLTLVSSNKSLIPDVTVDVPLDAISLQYALPSKTGVITKATTITITTNYPTTKAPTLSVTVNP